MGSDLRSDTRRLLLVTVAALVLFTYGLGVGALWDHDETTYTQVAREMLQRRDLFSLQVGGQPWFDKPPLFMWLQALTGHFFGFTEFTARIWSALFGAVAVAATFLLARLLYGSKAAVLAAAFLATTMQFLVSSRIAVLDPTLLAFMLLALYMYLVAYTTGSRRAHLWAWVWAGWATATKGPIGLLLPAVVIGALWIVRREWGRWREVPLWGPVLFAAIGLPWYVVETVRHGTVFLQTAVGHYLVGRFFGVVDNQPGPLWYYVPVLLAGGFPWTAFFPSAISYHLRRRHELGSQVIFLWIGVTLAFFSVAGTKVVNYVLPVYPLFAIGIARLWADALDGASREAWRLLRAAFGFILVGTAIFVAVTAVVGLVRYSAEVEALRAQLLIAAGVLAIGPVVALLAYWARRPVVALATLMLTPVAAMPVLVHHTLPALEQQRALPRIARSLRDLTRPGDTLAAVRMGETASLIYYSERPVIWVGAADQLGRALCRHDRLFLVVPDDEYQAWVAARLPSGVREHAQDGGYRILFKDGPTPCVRDRPMQ